MAGKVVNAAEKMVGSIGAIQTLIENFPMSFMNGSTLNIGASFDLISVLFKILGVDREKIVELVTNVLCGNSKDGGGFIDSIETIIKYAIEANIMKILNCTTNPIIENDLLDFYGVNKENSGNGVDINVSELDMTGVLSKIPFSDADKKFFFDIEDKNATNIYSSKDFNAFLWYIINKSDKSQIEECKWDDRYHNNSNKKIVTCTYDEDSDKIKVQICSDTYYKTRDLKNNVKINKTIFEFNHDFIHSIKLYDTQVIIAEIVEQILGNTNFIVNIGYSVNEEIIQGKVQEIIKKIIEVSDTEINDCYFSFSNDDYNRMLEQAEQNRYNVINNGNGFYEVSPNELLTNLTISSKTTLHEDKEIINKTLTDITAIPAKDPASTMTDSLSLGVNGDFVSELLKMIVFPLIRPLFTPKVLFLLIINQKIMGGREDMPKDLNSIYDALMNGIFCIIKDVIVKIKDALVEIFLDFIMKEIAPLIALFTSQLLLETLMMYHDLLMQILEKCLLNPVSAFFGQNLEGNIDDVNYADIIPVKTEPNQSIC